MNIPTLYTSKTFSRVVIALVAASVGYGLFLIGSPSLQRARAFDQRRVSDLQQIAGTIYAYWDAAQKLPADLVSLEKTPYFYISSMQDPRTKEPYEYRVKRDTAFELCAVFETDSFLYSAKETMPSFSRELWNHGAGRACFEREVLEKPAAKTEPMR
ncbi:MAG: hypothetical protein HYV78_02470 [Candidatus Wildermuthbacteria bacterium]|nr:hypothetical protein [Candidatus Wildermuthbacteria bacterium]